MTELLFIKGQKILCFYDSLKRTGKLNSKGFHNAQYSIVEGDKKKAYAVVSQEMSWVSSPGTKNKENMISNARVDDWKLWCGHKSHLFQNPIEKGEDKGRKYSRLTGQPCAIACKLGYEAEFIK